MVIPLITSWEIDGETVETVLDFILLGSKITADGDCSHEIKRHNFKAVPPLCQATGTGRKYGWTVEEGFPEKAVFESCPQQWRWDPQK